MIHRGSSPLCHSTEIGRHCVVFSKSVFSRRFSDPRSDGHARAGPRSSGADGASPRDARDASAGGLPAGHGGQVNASKDAAWEAYRYYHFARFRNPTPQIARGLWSCSSLRRGAPRPGFEEGPPFGFPGGKRGSFPLKTIQSHLERMFTVTILVTILRLLRKFESHELLCWLYLRPCWS